jgi:hypothetical protein
VPIAALQMQLNELRILPFSHVISLPFVPQLLASENFLRTEIHSYPLKQYAKNIFFYLEVQERMIDINQRYFILIAASEAGYLRYCLERNSLSSDKKSFGLRTLTGLILSSSKNFVTLDIPEIAEVQLHFLNGATENEIPSRLCTTWKAWIETCDFDTIKEKQKELHTALKIN